MKFVRREPGIGYLDNWLWIPKTHASRTHIESTFTYEQRDKVVSAWHEEPHHYRVPRNYLSPATLSTLGFPVLDARTTEFPRVALRSRAVLDAKEPDKDYQRRGSAALLGVSDGILCLRCGAGKTVVALHSAAQLGVPVLILVTDDGLASQWVEEIETWLGVPASDIGFIWGHAGRKFTGKHGVLDWEHDIVVAHVQTVAKRALEGGLPAEMAHHFGVVIADEAHVMGAPFFNSAIPPFRGLRWGLSATPSREDGFDSLLRYTIGPVVYSYLTPDLKPFVYFRRLPTTLDLTSPKTKDETHDSTGAFHFGMTFGYLAREKSERTDAIVKDVQDALDKGRQVLVLSHSKDMTEILGKRFPKAGVINSDVKGSIRLDVVRECNPVIAIMQLGKQALNKPSLDALFVTEPFSKEGVLQQTMGRALRKFGGKKDAVVVFYEDVNIKPLMRLCAKLRKKLTHWPEAKGGRIQFKILQAR